MALSTISASPSLEECYSSDIITGAHGDKYQKDLALALFERATRNEYDFRLGYEMAIADKFDDVVFFNKASKSWTLIQTKHADTSKGKSPLKFDMLFPQDEGTREKGDFSLYKYLKSYMTVKTNFKEQTNVIIFTNRDLAGFFEESVEVEPRQVDEILLFNHVNVNRLEPVKVKPRRQLGLKVNCRLLEEIVDYVNQDFNSLRYSIVKLFKEKTLDQVIKNFKTPVASILCKTGSSVKFAEDPSPEAYEMVKSLNTIIDTRTVEVPLEKCKDLFTGKSRCKEWPLSTNLDTARQFFQDLVLLISQPDDLSGNIDHDMRSWMRTWIRPDCLMQLEDTQLDLVVDLEKFFDAKQSPVKTADVRTSLKRFLQFNDGEEFFDSVKSKLEKLIHILTNNNRHHAHEFYIARSIEYMELSDDKQRNNNDGKGKQMRIRDVDFVNELHGKFKQQSFLLLTAEPGMGKSTILEHIAMAAQRTGSDFVYLFNLNAFNRTFESLSETDTIGELLSILGTVLSKEYFENLRKNMECENFNKKLLMVFDAFDEIFPHYRAKVCKMFKLLLTVANVKIIVSARKNVKTLLENKFKVNTMSLVPLDEQDKRNFLKQFWNVSAENNNIFQEYVAQLFKALQSGINRAFCDYIGVPLMLKMLAEVYADHYSKCLKSVIVNLEDFFSQEKFSTINLYDQFMRKCFKNRMVKKIGNVYQDNDEDNVLLLKNFTLQHQLLAIELQGIKVAKDLTNHEKYREILKQFKRRLITGTEKSPLVEAFDNVIRFVHLSYSEFLVAKFLHSNFENCDVNIFSKNSKAKLFDQFPMIKLFFFGMVEEQYRDEHLEILKRHYGKNSDIVLWACEAHGLKTTKFLLFNIRDSGTIKQVLKVAVEHNCPNICIYLLKNHQVFVDEIFDVNKSYQERLDEISEKLANQILGNSVDIKAKTKNNETLLHKAAKNGNMEVLKVLLDNSANIEAKNADDETSIHYAAKNGHWEVLKVLLDHSANIQAKSNYDETPLHFAACQCNLKALKVLLDNSAFIEAKTVYNETPLHKAALYGQLENLKMLLDNSADIEAKSTSYKTPLHNAALRGHLEIVKVLLNNSADIGAKTVDNYTPLHYAAIKGRLEIVKVLLDNSADIEAKTKYNETPLHLAAENGHLEVLLVLVDNSADIEAKTKNNETPLHLAARHGHLEVLQVLVDNSADIEAKTKYNETPLHLAAKNGRSKVLLVLVDNSADIEAKTKYNETPLHCAAEYGNLEIVKVLLEYSADTEVKNWFGETPSCLASKQGYTSIIKILPRSSVFQKMRCYWNKAFP